ncbi:hypothetical protein ACKU07_09620 [Enterobacter hormaechei]
MRKKSPHFHASSSSNMAVRGIDSLRSPCGQPVRYALSLSNWLRQLSNPVGALILPKGVQHAKKARIFMRALLQIWR